MTKCNLTVILPTVEELLQPPNTRVKCSFHGCLREFSTSSAMRMHKGKRHGVYESENERLALLGGKRKVSKKINHYFCPDENCNRSRERGQPFTKLSSLKSHYLSIHAERKLPCIKCGYKFASESQLKAHVSKCGRLFHCSCGTPFTTKEALYMHAKRSGHQLSTEFMQNRKYSWKKKDPTREGKSKNSVTNSELFTSPPEKRKQIHLLPKDHCILIVPKDAVGRVSFLPQSSTVTPQRKRRKAPCKRKANAAVYSATSRSVLENAATSSTLGSATTTAAFEGTTTPSALEDTATSSASRCDSVSVASQSVLSFSGNFSQLSYPFLSLTVVGHTEASLSLRDSTPDQQNYSEISSAPSAQIVPWLGHGSLFDNPLPPGHVSNSLVESTVSSNDVCDNDQRYEYSTHSGQQIVGDSTVLGQELHTHVADDNLSTSRSIGTMFETLGVPTQTDGNLLDLLESCDIETQTIESIFSCDAILRETCSTQTPRLQSVQNSVETTVSTKEAEAVVGPRSHSNLNSIETQTSGNLMSSQTQTRYSQELEDMLDLVESNSQTLHHVSSSPSIQHANQETQTLRVSPTDLLSMYTQTAFSQEEMETFTQRDVAVSFPDLPLSDMHTQTVNDFDLHVFDINENSASVQTDFPSENSVDSSTVAIQVNSPVFEV